MNWTITDEFKEELKQLLKLVTDYNDLQFAYDIIDEYEFDEDEDDEEDEFDASYELSADEFITYRKLEILQQVLEGTDSILQLDWQEEVEELKSGIEYLLVENFGVENISLPDPQAYGDETVSSDGVIEDFKESLEKQKFSLVSIESGDDNIWIIVFPIANQNQVEQLLNKMGFELR